MKNFEYIEEDEELKDLKKQRELRWRARSRRLAKFKRRGLKKGKRKNK